MTNTEARKTALLARMGMSNLIECARILEALGQTKSPEQRMTLAWITDEIETRAGVITDAELPEWERHYDESGSYLSALIALRPQLANL